MPGRSLISLTSMTFCFLRASFFFFCSSYLILAEIEDLADRRIGFGRYLDQVEAGPLSHARASFRVTTPTICPAHRPDGRAERRFLR